MSGWYDQLQAYIMTLADSREWRNSTALLSSSTLSVPNDNGMVIASMGQISTQMPQDLHFTGSTTIPSPSIKSRASWGQALTHCRHLAQERSVIDVVPGPLYPSLTRSLLRSSIISVILTPDEQAASQ